MALDPEKREALADAIRAAAEPYINDGEMPTSWIVVLATRGLQAGGAVVCVASEDGMPQYEARGLLATALRGVDRIEDLDQNEDGQS